MTSSADATPRASPGAECGRREEAGEGLLDDDVLPAAAASTAMRHAMRRHAGRRRRLGVEDGAKSVTAAPASAANAGALGTHRGHRAQVDRHPVPWR
jgi:hypothetical protein